MSATSHSDKQTSPEKTGHGITAKPWWPWVKNIVKYGFFAAVAYLLYTQAREVEWDEVLQTMRDRPLSALLLAALLAASSHALYGTFDLLGRHYTGHGLPKLKVCTVNFISYAFNLNMGSLIGGVGFRYRLYSGLGLEAGVITRVVLMSMFTNWLGYLLLGGAAFLLAPLSLPPDWKLDSWGLRWVGAAMVAVALAYMLMCAFSKRRTWTVRGHEMTLPSMRMALLQLAMSVTNWMLIGAIIFVLMEQKVDYVTVLSVLLIAAVAGVITHVPAGLGVLEAVFVALLSHRVPKSELLAVLLTYRALYYLIPLVVAAAAYLLMEARAKRSGSGRDPAPAAGSRDS